MSKYKFGPDYVVPPGSTLKESLDTQGISQTELARRTGLAVKTISQIINGIAPISYDTAEKLELVTRIPAGFWNRRELGYREALSRQKELKVLEKNKEWLKEIPIKELISRGFVEPTDDKGKLVHRALRFFGVSSVDAWQDTLSKSCAQYRNNKAQAKYPGFVAAWLRMGELQAEKIQCENFNGSQFRQLLKEEIRNLTTVSPNVWRTQLPKLCARVGVAVVLTKEIPKAAISGATRWLTKDKALIQVSLKFKTDDQLWFSFYHEAGHVLLHGKRNQYVDFSSGNKNEEERQANEFARDLLIPQKYIPELYSLRSKISIRQFAASIGVSSGIVVGRLQYNKILPLSHGNDLKCTYEWK